MKFSEDVHVLLTSILSSENSPASRTMLTLTDYEELVALGQKYIKSMDETFTQLLCKWVKFTHTARVHLSSVSKSGISQAPAIRSAPSLMDFINIENPEPRDTDITPFEESLFNSPDPYDLAKNRLFGPRAARTGLHRALVNPVRIQDVIQLTDDKLIKLITNIDTQGPGSAIKCSDVQAVPRRVERASTWDMIAS